MTPIEIQNRATALYEQIKSAEAQLRSLRAECEHPVSGNVIYSTRPGDARPAQVCADCGEFLQYLEERASVLDTFQLELSLKAPESGQILS
jgi:hypothetical protein